MKRYNVQVQYQTEAGENLPKADVFQQEFDWLRVHLQGVSPEVMRVDEIPEPEKCPECGGNRKCPACKGTGIKQDNTCPDFQTCQRLECMFDADILESQFQAGIMKICQECKNGKL